jgi:hypothetical protein
MSVVTFSRIYFLAMRIAVRIVIQVCHTPCFINWMVDCISSKIYALVEQINQSRDWNREYSPRANTHNNGTYYNICGFLKWMQHKSGENGTKMDKLCGHLSIILCYSNLFLKAFKRELYFSPHYNIYPLECIITTHNLLQDGTYVYMSSSTYLISFLIINNSEILYGNGETIQIINFCVQTRRRRWRDIYYTVYLNQNVMIYFLINM